MAGKVTPVGLQALPGTPLIPSLLLEVIGPQNKVTGCLSSSSPPMQTIREEQKWNNADENFKYFQDGLVGRKLNITLYLSNWNTTQNPFHKLFNGNCCRVGIAYLSRQ